MIQSIRLMKGEEMTTKDKVKLILGLISGIAADAAVTAALGSLMPGGGGWKRLLRMGGTFIIAMMAGEKVDDYVCRVFDETLQDIKEVREENENAMLKSMEGSVK